MSEPETSPEPERPVIRLPGERLQHPLQVLSALVVRDGVGLGGLPGVVQELVLALVWAGLPEADATEPQLTQWLQAQLAGPAEFLNMDPVELRRRLVDAGWLRRDRWGRVYRRTAFEHLAQAQRPLAQALAGTDTLTWAASQRAAHAATRQARRAAWQARVAAAPDDAGLR